jgi:hypothetical protein
VPTRHTVAARYRPIGEEPMTYADEDLVAGGGRSGGGDPPGGLHGRIAQRAQRGARHSRRHAGDAGAAPRQPATRYEAGARIGTHIGNETMSDVAVLVDDPNGYRLVSWFDAITDALFETYRARGLEARSDAIITRAARDASPLRCNGEAFADKGVLPNWIRLR